MKLLIGILCMMSLNSYASFMSCRMTYKADHKSLVEVVELHHEVPERSPVRLHKIDYITKDERFKVLAKGFVDKENDEVDVKIQITKGAVQIISTGLDEANALYVVKGTGENLKVNCWSWVVR